MTLVKRNVPFSVVDYNIIIPPEAIVGAVFGHASLRCRSFIRLDPTELAAFAREILHGRRTFFTKRIIQKFQRYIRLLRAARR